MLYSSFLPLPLLYFTMDILSALLRDIDYVRHILFTLPISFSLSRANYELFWLLINNIYLIQALNNVRFRKRNSRPAHVHHQVICRFKHIYNAPLISQGKYTSSSKHIITSYNVSFALLAFLNYYKYYLFN
jgi:hypothetical protein